MFFILIISERRMKINAFSIYMFSPRLMSSMHSWIKRPFYEIISQYVFSGARIPPHDKIISKKHCQSVLVYSNKMLDGYLVLHIWVTIRAYCSVCAAGAVGPLMNESQLNCGRPPEWIGVQTPLELVEAEHVCSNKCITFRSVMFVVAFTQDSWLERERKKERKNRTAW